MSSVVARTRARNRWPQVQWTGANHGVGWFEISGIAGNLRAPHPGPPMNERLPTAALEPDFGRCLTAGLL